MEVNEVLENLTKELEDLRRVREVFEKQLKNIKKLEKDYLELDYELGKLARAIVSGQEVFQNHKDSLEVLNERIKKLEDKEKRDKDMMIT